MPAPAVKSVGELLEGVPRPADASIARSGETLRQGEWRDELLRAGIRGKAGQHIRFVRLEPLPGCHYLHADGETRTNDAGADRVRERGAASEVQRIVVAFGPEHAPLEQRQVAQAIEEAQTLVPRPKLIVFAVFQFDPEAAKDIDETNWPGVTLLKAQMNADLLTDDLKKKRASNESFWLIGQPDVRIERIAKGEDMGKGARNCPRLRLLQHQDRRHRIWRRGSDRRLAARHRLRRAQSLPPSGVLPDGRGEGRMGAVGEEPEGRDRRRADRSLPGHGVVAVRAW